MARFRTRSSLLAALVGLLGPATSTVLHSADGDGFTMAPRPEADPAAHWFWVVAITADSVPERQGQREKAERILQGLVGSSTPDGHLPKRNV